jgi:hypothetical protein
MPVDMSNGSSRRFASGHQIQPTKGRRKKITKPTCICLSPRNKVGPSLKKKPPIFYRVFLAFRNKGSLKTRQNFFQKVNLGSSQKVCVFFSSVFFSLGCFPRFFYRVFGRFITGGVQNVIKITEIFPKPPKKVLTYLRRFFSPLVFGQNFLTYNPQTPNELRFRAFDHTISSALGLA